LNRPRGPPVANYPLKEPAVVARIACLSVATVAAALLLLPGDAAAAQKGSKKLRRAEAILAEMGIDPSPQGALEYLQAVVPVGDPNETIDQLIEQLGDADFARREQAALRLINLSALPREKLEAATRSADAEIRWRADAVLKRLGSAGNRGMIAALQRVAADPPEGTVPALLDFARLRHGDGVQRALHETLREIATHADLEALLAAAGAKEPTVRLAAAQALETLDDKRGRDALAELLSCDDQAVVFAAARCLGNAGDRRALPALVELLRSEDMQYAEASSNFFVSLTKQQFAISRRLPADERLAAYNAARQWLETEGAAAELHFPVLDPAIARGDLAGNTLVATGNAGKAVEIDVGGKVVWSFPTVAWSAEKLTNGNVLVASYSENRVVEVDARGELVWTLPGVNAMRAKPLSSGNILIADFGGQQVIEIDDSRKTVWSVKTPDNCFDAERLPNGNTVFACPQLIREVNGEGETVRSLTLEGRVNGLQVLPNGHWLVANYGSNQVQEYDLAGELKWKFDERSPCDVFRLPSGNTLITTASRAFELDADGQTVRPIMEAKYGCARQ
jgi:hypothetical protein